jgi:hypothetical protein
LGWITWIPRLMGGAVSTWMGLLALTAAALGILARAPAAVVLGGVSFAACGIYVLRVSAVRADIDRAFGPGWIRHIHPAIQPRLHRRRWSLAAPHARQESHIERDIPFWTVPAGCTSNGQPPEGIPPSRLGYWHSSARMNEISRI